MLAPQRQRSGGLVANGLPRHGIDRPRYEALAQSRAEIGVGNRARQCADGLANAKVVCVEVECLPLVRHASSRPLRISPRDFTALE